ncbi:TetR/AcrR family transcriptional regulator [Cyanobium sp. NIES-981]|uniref:TetR/AcrR family transcriptional regulator n=1 Tax=Cyanobium sp. NIES-981 TaxID=1851505 RepID=UPI0007DCEBD4|nr:TetR/AcrR family transcriptional regulator [Cyanobium sp. NIES-981]SBO42111.1 Transcriptional regulator [Cyanobium sp. NIES-981]
MPSAAVPATTSRGLRAERKRQAILDGARQEFLSHGYAATSMDRIARAAHVSKATVYSHFADKKALFRALTEQMVGERLSELFGSSPGQSLPPDPAAALTELAARCLARRPAQPPFLSLLRLVIGESERFPELARTFVAQLERTGVAQVVHLFEALPAGPEAELRARVFMGALVHLILMQDLLHGREVAPVDRQAYAAVLVKLVQAGSDGGQSTNSPPENRHPL